MSEKLEDLRKRRKELLERISFTEKSRNQLNRKIGIFLEEYSSKKIDKEEYERRSSEFLGKRTLKEWHSYYDNYIELCNFHVSKIDRDLKKVRAKTTIKKALPFIIISLSLIFILVFFLSLEKEVFFAPEIHSQEILQDFDSNGVYLWELENLGVLQSASLSGSLSGTGSASIFLAVPDEEEEVYLLAEISSSGSFDEVCLETCDLTGFDLEEESYELRVELFENARVSLHTIFYEILEEEEEPGDEGTEDEEDEESGDEIGDEEDGPEPIPPGVTLTLPEPISDGQSVTVTGPDGMTNVPVFTDIPEDWNILSPSSLDLYWVERGISVPFTLYDLNGNGIFDTLAWIAPHLSTQTFEIIVITNAKHLDENRNLISNIFSEVRILDDVWSETIQDTHYVRVTFEVPLDKSKDITLYPRIISGAPSIEVYEVGGTELIAEFTSLEVGRNTVFLTDLIGTQDTFDLKIKGGAVEFDYIVDPAIFLVGSASGNTDNVASVVIDVSGIGVQDDDLILFFGSCDGLNGGYDLPTGFIPLQDADTLGSHNNLLGYKIASGEPSSYTVNVGNGNERGIAMFAVYRNVDVSDPIDNSNSNINTGVQDMTGVITPITPSKDNSAVVVFIGTESGNDGSLFINPWPSPLIEQLDNVNGPPGNGAASSGGGYAHTIQTTSTTVSGNIDVSTTGVTNWGVMAVVLNALSISPPSDLTCGGGSCDITVDASVNLEGIGSIDPDGDPVTYEIEASLDSPLIISEDQEIGNVQLIANSGLGELTTIFSESFPTVDGGWIGDDEGDTVQEEYWIVTQELGDLTSISISSDLSHQGGSFLTPPSSPNFVRWIECDPNNFNGCFAEGRNTGGTHWDPFNSGWINGNINFNYNYYVDLNEGLRLEVWRGTDWINVWEVTALENNEKSGWININHQLTADDLATSEFSFRFSADAPGGQDIVLLDDVKLNVNTGPSPSDNEATTNWQNYGDIISADINKLNQIDVRVSVSLYGGSGSISNSNVAPDLEVEMWDGSNFISTGFLNVNAAGEFVLTVTNPSILTAWQTVTNRDIRIRGVNFDYFDVGNFDQIDYTNVFVSINGKQWTPIGSHPEGVLFTWDTSSIPDQENVNLRARAIDPTGSNTYSDYFTKNPTSPFLEISHVPAGGPNVDSISEIPDQLLDDPSGLNSVPFDVTVSHPGGLGQITSVTAEVTDSITTTRIAVCGTVNSITGITSCTVDMRFFDPPGAWQVSATATDVGGQSNTLLSPFTVLEYTELIIDTGVNFGQVLPGTFPNNDQATTLMNFGNMLINSATITASDLVGQDGTLIFTSNFAINGDDTSPGSSGGNACLETELDSGILTTIPNFTPLPSGINSQGKLHICLKSVPSPLPIQSYAASWEIIVALAALSIARKKRRKKRKASKEELLDDYFLDEKLKIRYGVGLDELLGNAGVISKSAEGIKIPLGIFNQKVSPAEALCKYLKENEEFKFSEIAEIINRDQRTVALNYRNAVKKKKEKMKIVKGELFISAKVFADRRLSVLESVVDHLKNKGLKNSEIAEILNKDSKNIWTLHSRAKKKLAKLNKNV